MDRPSPHDARRRPRAAAARPGRLAAAGLAVVTLTAALLLLWAAAARANDLWVIPAANRAFPDTQPGSHQTIELDAAGNEYQGVQVCLRGPDGRSVRFSWAAGSDPLIVANTVLDRVYYVHVTTPTTAMGSKPGWYPDPLVPRAFGEATTVPGNDQPGGTTPFYLLVHVPLGATPGTYTATLRVENGDQTLDVPFSLRVWNFGWRQISTHSAFAVSARNLASSLPIDEKYMGGETKDKVLAAFCTMMKQHGISPTLVSYLPKVSASGSAAAGAWADKVAPFLDANGIDLQDNQLPFLRWFPWGRSKNPSTGQISTYLTDMCRVYKERGWQDKAYVYVLDETTKSFEERQAERYAQIAHAASARSGFRVRFLLTDDPRPRSLGGVKSANSFLNDDVDIWALRYYYFFGRIPAVRERKAAGKEIWWYSYPNGSVKRTPSFVIDKPHVDSRAWGWLMEQWNVDGILNYGFNRWGKATSGEGWRDPYQDPLSLVKGRTRSNGDTCLVYPGYYPRYGLNDIFAPPVSSLRLEMLRDGLEEREYLKLVEAAGPDGRALADRVLASITKFPFKIQQANVFHFPVYAADGGVYDAARAQLAAFIEAHQQ